VVTALAAGGTSEQVRAQLERWDAVTDIVMIGLPPGLPWPTVETTLRVAAPQDPAAVRPEPPVVEFCAARQ
jgi:hypothetical protein